MATYTSNYNIPKYEGTDAPNLLDQYNGAMDIIDGKLADSLRQATGTAPGNVTLVDTISGGQNANQGYAVTPAAIQTALGNPQIVAHLDSLPTDGWTNTAPTLASDSQNGVSIIDIPQAHIGVMSLRQKFTTVPVGYTEISLKEFIPDYMRPTRQIYMMGQLQMDASLTGKIVISTSGSVNPTGNVGFAIQCSEQQTNWTSPLNIVWAYDVTSA